MKFAPVVLGEDLKASDVGAFVHESSEPRDSTRLLTSFPKVFLIERLRQGSAFRRERHRLVLGPWIIDPSLLEQQVHGIPVDTLPNTKMIFIAVSA